MGAGGTSRLDMWEAVCDNAGVAPAPSPKGRGEPEQEWHARQTFPMLAVCSPLRTEEGLGVGVVKEGRRDDA